MSGINRISIVIPPAAGSSVAGLRDEAISKLSTALGVSGFDLYHYSDTSSGLGTWAYLAIMYAYVDGDMTIGTVSCTGMVHPPSGSNMGATSDPGAGSYTWSSVYGLPRIAISGGGGGGSVPQGNNNFYVWNIPGNSSAAATDFTTAVTVVEAALAASLLGGAVQKKYLKYVDGISGAWQFSAIYFGAGCAEFGTTSTVSVLPNNNILYVVTCSGTPNPPTGSTIPAVSVPAFTQTGIVTITAPLSFGPMR